MTNQDLTKSNQDDLISREALKEAIRKRLGISSLKYLTEQEKIIVDEIDNAPKIDTYTEDDVQEAIKAGYQVGYELPKAKFEKNARRVD